MIARTRNYKFFYLVYNSLYFFSRERLLKYIVEIILIHITFRKDHHMFTNAEPRTQEPYLGIEYKTPSVFDMSKSKGSVPLLVSATEFQPQTEADVVPIEKVRLIQAQPQSQRLTVNLSPYDQGHLAFIKRRKATSNPFPKTSPDHSEWLDGFWSDQDW